MKLFTPLPGFRKTPPGKERVVLRNIPKWLWLGSAILAIPSLLVRLLSDESQAQMVMTTDIYVASLIVLHWTVLFTVAIAAFIIMTMKGPAYVADPYPLNEAETLEGKPSALDHAR